ncbi:hypothetical protein HK097_001009 [Rhizophlyctis rosea]|uniref:Myb-like domain-containing protein n=1 Tax=Rhizophlyctis rosea TaxID=64517 RepID=A0AAD5SCX1_9FUNG|nr:hypothetical protein HK097_001009 [Rhizophlyctis rosea]
MSFYLHHSSSADSTQLQSTTPALITDVQPTAPETSPTKKRGRKPKAASTEDTTDGNEAAPKRARSGVAGKGRGAGGAGRGKGKKAATPTITTNDTTKTEDVVKEETCASEPTSASPTSAEIVRIPQDLHIHVHFGSPISQDSSSFSDDEQLTPVRPTASQPSTGGTSSNPLLEQDKAAIEAARKTKAWSEEELKILPIIWRVHGEEGTKKVGEVFNEVFGRKPEQLYKKWWDMQKKKK